MDLHPLAHLERLTVVLASFRTEDGDVEAGPPKGQTLLPNAPIEGNGEILDEEERAWMRAWLTATSPAKPILIP